MKTYAKHFNTDKFISVPFNLYEKIKILENQVDLTSKHSHTRPVWV